jgi:hypothetical protein
MARAANTKGVDAAVMARLRAPFGCEFIYGADDKSNRWRIHDANDDAIASVSGREEGYARLIVAALNRGLFDPQVRLEVALARVTELEDTVANVVRIACAASNDAERDLRESGLL